MLCNWWALDCDMVIQQVLINAIFILASPAGIRMIELIRDEKGSKHQAATASALLETAGLWLLRGVAPCTGVILIYCVYIYILLINPFFLDLRSNLCINIRHFMISHGKTWFIRITFIKDHINKKLMKLAENVRFGCHTVARVDIQLQRTSMTMHGARETAMAAASSCIKLGNSHAGTQKASLSLSSSPSPSQRVQQRLKASPSMIWFRQLKTADSFMVNLFHPYNDVC